MHIGSIDAYWEHRYMYNPTLKNSFTYPKTIKSKGKIKEKTSWKFILNGQINTIQKIDYGHEILKI